MILGGIFDTLSPDARVATAIVPFAAAMILRFLLGKSKTTGWMVSLSTLWFAINVLLAPYSTRMQSDIESLRYTLFR